MQQTNDYAIASLCFGIFSLLSAIFVTEIGVLLGIAAIVSACLNANKRGAITAAGYAGIIMGMLAIVFSFLYFVLYLMGFVSC